MKVRRLWMERASIACAALVAMSAMAAQADLAGRLDACVKEADDAARLACYDRAMGRSADADPASGAAAIDTFGVSGSEVARKRGAEQNSNASAKVDHVNAKVTAISKRPRGELVITLDNGQVWAQKNPQYMPLEIGDDVTILAGSLNSYRLIFESRATPVTRIQ